MTSTGGEPTATRSRREPPPLVPVTLVGRAVLSDRMLRLTFEGVGLRELVVPDPAASVRLLVPSPAAGDDLELPEWNGNEFLLADGSRPALRTFTPLRVDNDAGRLDLEIVRHAGGAVSGWAERARPGAEAAISGPGRGYEIDVTATRFILLGDETAVPAIGQLVTVLSATATVEVHIAAAGADLVAAARSLGPLDDTTRVWAAGEAAAMQAIRRHLFEALGVPRSHATVRGYWKPARG